MAGKIIDVTLKLIDKLTGPIGSINSRLTESANQWTKAGKKIERSGKKITEVGGAMTSAVTVPVLGAGIASVKLAGDFEAGMSKVKSISGATTKEVGILGEKAKEMGAKTKFSAAEATEAYSYMAMAGWDAADMLGGIEGIMYLAGATGEDLASTSDIVTDAMTAFGMSADGTTKVIKDGLAKEVDNASYLADILAATSANANTNVSMLGESFKYAAPVAGALGFSAEDTAVALGLMANAGIKASQGGTSLRSIMTNLAKPTDKMKDAMDYLGISLQNGDGSMKSLMDVMRDMRGAFGKCKMPLDEFQGSLAEVEDKYASGELTEKKYNEAVENLTEKAYGAEGALKAKYAATIAGKNGMSGLLAVVNASDGDFDKLTEAVQNSNGACEEMYKIANNNLNGQISILKSTVEALGQSFGEILLPYVKKSVEWLQKATEKFNGLDSGTKKSIGKFALIAAAVGPALVVFGKTVTGVGKVISAVGKFGKALRTFGSLAGIIASPAGIVIAVLAGIVVAVVLVIKNWDKVKDAAQRVFGYVKSIFGDLGISFDSAKDKLAPIGEKFAEVGGKVQELWTIVQPYLSKFGEVVKDIFMVKLGAAIGGAIGFFQSLFDSAANIISGLLKAFGGLIDFLTGVFTGDWSRAWDGVKSIFSGAFGALAELCKAPMNAVIGIINGAIAGINNIGIKIPDWVPGLGGKDFSINIPKIPALAVGTEHWKGGLAQISERGGEIVDLPRGARVYPHDKSVQKAYSDGVRSGRGGITVNIPKLADKIVIREEADIYRIANALGEAMEKLSGNMGGAELGYLY